MANATEAALGKSGGIQLPNRLTPLFSLYSDVGEDYFYTTVPQLAAAAELDWSVYYSPCGPRRPRLSNIRARPARSVPASR